jgi:hypothetical protein
MSGPLLFLRARRTGTSAVALLLLGLIQKPLGNAAIRLGSDRDFAIPWVVMVPVVSGAIIGTFTATAMGSWEFAAARSVQRGRAAHLALLLLIAMITTSWGTADLTGQFSNTTALRNVAGFTGLALLAATVFGSRLAWTLPMLIGLTSLVSGVYEGRPAGWAWPIHGNGDPGADLTALLLLIAGATWIIRSGTREPKDEHPT